jgi:hypothetical protein
LATAYLNLKRYDLAASALDEARHIAPADLQVERLTTILNGRRTAESSSAANSALLQAENRP